MSHKKEQYLTVLKQVQGVLEDEHDLIANLANVSAIVMDAFKHHWVGFYLVKGNELVLGPFQGPVACTRILKGKGVCGSAWLENKIFNVADVHQFPGHIACSAFSNSEIVVPLSSGDEVFAVLDIDSELFNQFDETDEKFLSQICELIKP
jgi:GAF domain-containing protein